MNSLETIKCKNLFQNAKKQQSYKVLMWIFKKIKMNMKIMMKKMKIQTTITLIQTNSIRM